MNAWATEAVFVDRQKRDGRWELEVELLRQKDERAIGRIRGAVWGKRCDHGRLVSGLTNPCTSWIAAVERRADQAPPIAQLG